MLPSVRPRAVALAKGHGDCTARRLPSSCRSPTQNPVNSPRSTRVGGADPHHARVRHQQPAVREEFLPGSYAGAPMTSASTLDDWARLLKREWEARGTLPSRDLFVASHPGWNDPVAWERTAATEVELFLAGLDADWLRTVEVLELGCGSGRLARRLRAATRSYTGFDIAPSMVAAAQQRCADLDGARFFVGDGLSVPAGARDRAYGLVLAVAVFIHCPRAVV